jgi:O-phosphoseryl-tRNA(Cys) synthetase
MNNTKAINDLKSADASVHIQHYRLFDTPSDFKVAEKVTKQNRVAAIEKRWNAKLSPHGGATFVEVKAQNGEIFQEVSRCRTNEQFQKSLGVSICLSRIEKRIIGSLATVTKTDSSTQEQPHHACD